MSNTQVGNVYQQIIADVVESSRVDFEEGGVDEHVLEELRQGWQNKLSQLQVAVFPWDPKPEPQPIVQPPTVPSNAGNYQQMGPPQGNFNPPMQNNGPRIKSEPGLESPTGISQAPFQQPQPLLGPGASTAQQRAAQNLRDNYGQRAAASINAIQGNVPQPQGQQQQQQMHMQQQQQQQPRPQYSQEQIAHMQQQRAQGMPVQPRMTPDQLQQYRQAMAQNAANQAAQAHQRQQNGVQGAQTDGAGDDFVVMRGEEVMGRVEIDGLIRNKIAAMGQSMEGGGLMLPLHQATSTKSRQRKVKKSGQAGKGQMDGGDSDEDDKDGVKEEDFDEDAINSDLDDPDDGLNDEEDDDEGMGHIMLCMYDKVQRVKNKWKCVMKDGVLTVNGKEYVFHKATGEYEW